MDPSPESVQMINDFLSTFCGGGLLRVVLLGIGAAASGYTEIRNKGRNPQTVTCIDTDTAKQDPYIPPLKIKLVPRSKID